MKAYNYSDIEIIAGDLIKADDVTLALFGIRAPGLTARGGAEAKAALEQKISDHGTVLIKIIMDRRRDKQHDLCEIFTPEGENINLWMAQLHHAQIRIGGSRE